MTAWKFQKWKQSVCVTSDLNTNITNDVVWSLVELFSEELWSDKLMMHFFTARTMMVVAAAACFVSQGRDSFSVFKTFLRWKMTLLFTEIVFRREETSASRERLWIKIENKSHGTKSSWSSFKIFILAGAVHSYRYTERKWINILT